MMKRGYGEDFKMLGRIYTPGLMYETAASIKLKISGNIPPDMQWFQAKKLPDSTNRSPEN